MLLASGLLTIARGMTLPFMTIYLTERFGWNVQSVGTAMTLALGFSTLSSLLSGMLADSFDKKRFLSLSALFFGCGFALLPLCENPYLVVFIFSLVNATYSLFAIVIKSYFSETLAIEERPRVFSLNYTFINIGWAVGPPIGTWVMSWSLNLPFWLAALTVCVPWWLIASRVPPLPPAALSDGSHWQPRLLLHDRALAWFTLSNFLSQLAFGAFTACLAQYAIARHDATLAAQIVAVVLPVNATIVVVLQYLVGKRLRPENLQRMMGFGTIFFIFGLAGFMISGTNLWLWGLSAVIFTLGELIFVPGEYMLIDNIAPDGMKASYFSAQTLGTLGGALNPLLTGYLLLWIPGSGMFMVFISVVVMAWVALIVGMRQVSPAKIRS
ncbi:MFS transporter [Salmonella enterica subsp. enterica serovar Choleraesuis]|nr:MFS transporter [Salmonella enterica subsp. enterica serovar Choleraesuis]